MEERPGTDGTAWIDLPAPRALDSAERAVLEALVGHVRCGPLTEQAASIHVTATCRCGCASVRLHSAGPSVPAETVSRLSSTGRDDYVGITATADPAVDIVVHVCAGTLTELELYAGHGVPVDIPAPERLRDLTVI